MTIGIIPPCDRGAMKMLPDGRMELRGKIYKLVTRTGPNFDGYRPVTDKDPPGTGFWKEEW